jgi:hypothetical protein
LKLLIYALGYGWGHLTRAVALASAVGQKAHVRILANSPYLSIVHAAMPELSIDEISTRDHAAAWIAREDPDLLVVDTFPRGLGGELAALLPHLRATKVLIHRDVNPEFVQWANLAQFTGEHYSLILCPGESGPLANSSLARRTMPWLVRAPIAVQPGADAVITTAGNATELPWYGEAARLLARDVNLRCLAPQLPPGCPRDVWIRHWPSIDWIAAAQVAVGGAGYNTVNECIALSVPLVARPWPRKYDRQRLRAETSPGVTIVETPQACYHAVLNALQQPRTPRPAFRNGADEAAECVLAMA